MIGAQILLCWIFVVTACDCAQAKSDFSVTAVTVDAVMRPKQPIDAFKECTHDAVCGSVIRGRATYLGVSSALVSGAAAIVQFAAARLQRLDMSDR